MERVMMHDMKIRHKENCRGGVENAGLKKMPEKSVLKANSHI